MGTTTVALAPMRPATLRVLLVAPLFLLSCASALERGRAAASSGDGVRAEQYFRKAIAGDPADKSAAELELSTLKFQQAQRKAKADPAAAEKLIAESLALSPGNENSLDLLGRVLAVQGRNDEAIALLEGARGNKPCERCRRYLAVLLLERAAKREADRNWEGARADYGRAIDLVPDAGTALALARCNEQLGDSEGTAKAVERAVPLIRADDNANQVEFRNIRERRVIAAAENGDLALCDRWLNFFPPNAGGDGWYVLHLRVVRELYRQKKIDVAIGRARHILGPTHEGSLPPTRKAEFQRFLADIYRLQGVGFLREGKLIEADDNFRLAMEYSPGDDKIKLLRALAIAGNKDVAKALQVVHALPKETKGYNEVLAILESMNVAERLAEEDLEGAKAALDRAQAASSETPEVHVAVAEMFFVTPIPGVTKTIVRQIKKTGLIKYPNDEINRYGEALSELAWAREQAKVNGGDNYLFRGPGIDGRMANLERQIRAFYPFTVEFNADSTTIMRMRFKDGSSGEVSVRVGDDEQSLRVPAGSEGAELVLREPGLTFLRVGGKTQSFVTEPYTKLTIEL